MASLRLAIKASLEEAQNPSVSKKIASLEPPKKEPQSKKQDKETPAASPTARKRAKAPPAASPQRKKSKPKAKDASKPAARKRSPPAAAPAPARKRDKKLSVAVGDAVEALWPADGEYYPARVRTVNADGTVALDYADGDQRSDAKASEIRPQNKATSKKLQAHNAPGAAWIPAGDAPATPRTMDPPACRKGCGRCFGNSGARGSHELHCDGTPKPPRRRRPTSITPAKRDKVPQRKAALVAAPTLRAGAALDAAPLPPPPPRERAKNHDVDLAAFGWTPPPPSYARTAALLRAIEVPRTHSRENITLPEDEARGVRSACVGLVGARSHGVVASQFARSRPSLTRELVRLGRHFLPKTFKFTSIQLNHGFASALHVDDYNSGPSYICGVGDYKGGDLWTLEHGPLDCRHGFCSYDGSLSVCFAFDGVDGVVGGGRSKVPPRLRFAQARSPTPRCPSRASASRWSSSRTRRIRD